MTDQEQAVEKKRADHDALVESLADTGFRYLHIDWRKCGCVDAEEIRSAIARTEGR